MKRLWVLSGLLVAAAAPAVAQQEPYETPKYGTVNPSTLDKDFGLPTFGTPAAILPQQRTMATERKPADDPDFFAKPPDTDLPKPRTTAGSDMDASEFAPSDGAMSDDIPKFDFGTSETDTPPNR